MLVEKSSADVDLMIGPGDLVYPFSFVLPTRLPTSFESFDGHIRYSVKAILGIPWAMDKHVDEIFTVISPLDLNLVPHLKNPFAFKEEMRCHGILSRGGHLEVYFGVPKSKQHLFNK